MRLRLALVTLAALVVLVTAFGPPPATASLPYPAVGTGVPSSGGNGTLALAVTPATAEVMVNGSAIHLSGTGAASLNLSAGSYPVAVTAQGYKEFEGNVTVLGGQVAYLTIQLVPNPPPPAGSSLSLGSFPVAVTATVVGILAIVVLGVLLWRVPRLRGPAPSAPVAPAEPSREEGPE
ncbi:MAG: PEGA domain-containing protein [Thermoplasmata archaeon]|nr:PEGA domain-containing protein [Thermoplasmata archaeon]